MLHGSFREVERVRNAGHCLALAVKQHQRLAVRFRQRAQRRPDKHLFLVGDRPFDRRWTGRGEVDWLVERLRPRLAPRGRPCQIACDAADPRLEFGSLSQLVELLPGRQKRLLSNVFATADVSEHGVRNGANGRLMPPHQLTEGSPIAGMSATHEFGVAHHRSIRHCFHVEPFHATPLRRRSRFLA